MRNPLLRLFLLIVPVFSFSQQEKKGVDVLKLSQQYSAKEKKATNNLLQIAKQKGWALMLKSDNPNQLILLTGIDSRGFPVYTTTNNNTIAATTTHTNQLWQGGTTGFNLSGSSSNIQGKIAIWDGGVPMGNHIELNGKIINKDGSSILDHTTHVSGTLMANGINPLAKGMAYGATQLNCYDFNNQISEMLAAAGNLLLSNHSYGTIAGWNKTPLNVWQYWGNPSDTADYKFGIYDEDTQMFDSIAYNAPYYLIVKSTGNNRDKNGPAVGVSYQAFDNNGVMADAGPRPAGISNNNGYDNIPTYGVAKNILTVGAVEGIASGSTKSADIKMSTFSSWGPTDDGRIKPDLVADGVDVLSCSSNSSTSYETMSGTSMATPNVTGSLYLLQELYSKKNSGNFMKASTLKALAIHTASEAGDTIGPDYKFGWGLLNVEKAARIIAKSNSSSDTIIETTLNNNDTFRLNVIASGNGTLMATMGWTDPVGAITTTSLLNNPSLKLIHDLDIRIIKGTSVYMPWVLDPSNPSNAASKGDNFRDNVERVEADNIVPGQSYTIQITHKGMLQRGSQDFSLIVAGIGGRSYCPPSTINNGDVRIDNFSFANVNNVLSTCNSYVDNTNLTANVEPSKTYSLNISLSSCNSSANNKTVKVYIDYNENNSFSEANELVYIGGTVNGTLNANITIPNNVAVGNYTLMRIIVAETSVAFDACSPINLIGETQDYRVQFINPKTDVSLTNIDIPTNNICSNNNQFVSVRITNNGDSAVSNIPLAAVVKNGTATIATLQGNYRDTLASGASIIYTFQTPFTSVAATTYNITATANLSNDQNITNDTISGNVTIASVPPSTNGFANICGNTAQLKIFGSNSNQNYYWYNDILATSPIATGSNTTTSIIANTYYVGSGNSTNIGAASKNIFTDGDYQAKGGNYFKYNATVPVLLENAKIYTSYPGKVTLIVADIKGTLANGSYNYNTLDSTTIDVSASRPTKMRGDISGNDIADTGLIYNINLYIPAGNHALIVKTDSVANIFRNNNIAANPYPYSIPNVFTITGNNATNPSQFYYYLYNMHIRTLDCTSDRIAVVPVVAAIPSIAQVGDSLVSNTGISFQWQKDTVDIANEINQSYKPTANGIYSCVVTDNSGCQQRSNFLLYPTNKDFIIKPNPAYSFVDISFNSLSNANTQIYIVDATGKFYGQQSFANSVGSFNTRINTSSLAAGVYVLNVLHGNEIYRKKFVIVR